MAMSVVTLNSLDLKEVTVWRPRALSTPLLQQLGPGGHTESRGSEMRERINWRQFAEIMIEGQLKDRERLSSEFMTLMDASLFMAGTQRMENLTEN